MAGCIRTVEPTAENVKLVGPPLTVELTIGSVVIHVALPWMRLAPGVFVRSDILRFGEIGGAWILRWDPSRSLSTMTRCDTPVVAVAAVIVGGRWVTSR